MSDILKVFISSTSVDLKDYRAVARNAILEAEWLPVFMENFGAMPEETVDACYAKLKDCHLVVLLVAFRRGWVPTEKQGGNGEDSVTALELKFARQRNIPVLAFLANDDWPGKLWDKGPDGEWIDKFRKELNQPADFFEYEDTTGKESDILPKFRAMILHALDSHKLKLRDQQPRPISLDGMENFPGASDRLLSGRCIPFLGHGVYGNGNDQPLSICALRKDLGDESCQDCHESPGSCQKSCLATAAEYKSRTMGRDLFLKHLQKIIEAQTKIIVEQKARNPKSLAVYDLLQKIKPPLIVSATEDLVLEEQLAAAGKRCLILCHVIRSAEKGAEDYNQKILVFNGYNDTDPKPRVADHIDELIDEEKELEEKKAYIVYKPFGSPLLHRYLNPALGIDTVVMTEEDYLILLRRLENEKTGVPKAFSTLFQTYPPIFLGYPMDVWHYRLVGKVFQTIGLTNSNLKPFFSVRQTDLSLEKQAWKGLGVDLVPMDPNDFSQKVEAP